MHPAAPPTVPPSEPITKQVTANLKVQATFGHMSHLFKQKSTISTVKALELHDIEIQVPEKFSILERCLLSIMETEDIVEIY
jgi:hypothetical protein